jgi:hypothetical protein
VFISLGDIKDLSACDVSIIKGSLGCLACDDSVSMLITFPSPPIPILQARMSPEVI